jgi:transcriptional regulator with XRE-family HTH domain
LAEARRARGKEERGIPVVELLMPIGDRLKQLRKAKKLSQMELARQSGLSLSIITQLEQGLTADPRLSTLKALARVLGCTLDELGQYDDQGEAPPEPRPRKPKAKDK